MMRHEIAINFINNISQVILAFCYQQRWERCDEVSIGCHKFGQCVFTVRSSARYRTRENIFNRCGLKIKLSLQNADVRHFPTHFRRWDVQCREEPVGRRLDRRTVSGRCCRPIYSARTRDANMVKGPSRLYSSTLSETGAGWAPPPLRPEPLPLVLEGPLEDPAGLGLGLGLFRRSISSSDSRSLYQSWLWNR